MKELRTAIAIEMEYATIAIGSQRLQIYYLINVNDLYYYEDTKHSKRAPKFKSSKYNRNICYTNKR